MLTSFEMARHLYEQGWPVPDPPTLGNRRDGPQAYQFFLAWDEWEKSVERLYWMERGPSAGARLDRFFDGGPHGSSES